ncbi:RNA-directed DNA polymerase-like protein [Gossypium australe]|uniref:RNA-directed DNA polymerase-like protein n=1 Tax=Gossypium australe TaxID=47621 RepID=A0A5B6X3A3_9ROSI|nr:RNA-directed DNA polymerase-like protein [Gossypium australe]
MNQDGNNQPGLNELLNPRVGNGISPIAQMFDHKDRPIREHDNTLLVVVSAELTYEQEVQLLVDGKSQILKESTPQSAFTKFYWKNFHGSSIKQQWRLNPIMKKVVKKEKIKWMDDGIIYPISNNSWVSLA